VPERYLGQPLGKYRVESLLGTGGFAWVFKGYDPELEIPVAIKVLKPQFAGDSTLVERFRREASTAARLRHPNIIKIYAVGREGDAVYFVMDFLPGGLADKLEATPSLPEDYVIRIGIDVARALGFAHREGVIHRDIKVDNILFDSHGNAVVADFGIARAVSGYTQQTGTNMVVGTPQYFAPEQARAKPLDGRADIYSLGVTLFRASTGRLPFEGDDWYEIARQHVEERPPIPREINPAITPEFERVMLRCLEKSPDDRPSSGEELAQELEQLLAFRKDPSLSRTLTLPATQGATLIAPVGGRRTQAKARTPTPAARRARIIVPGVLAALGLVAVLVAVLANGPEATALTDSTRMGDTSAIDTPTVIITGGDPAGADSGGRGARPDSASKGPLPPPKASLLVTAPSDAVIMLNDSTRGTGPLRIDSLAPGDYVVTATVPSVEGCASARQQKSVRLRPGARPTTVSIMPQPCGTVTFEPRLDATARNTPGDLSYRIFASDGAVVRQGTLPLAEPLVLPVGTYRFSALKPRCSPYDETLQVVAGTPLVVRWSVLC
jgi:serine/threonine-protein kinase